MKEQLRIAVQKSGRLNGDSLQLLQSCGIKFNKMDNKLKTDAYNFDLQILFLRDDDIPGYVADGVADAGIVGENVLYEKQQPCRVVEKMGFGRCRLSLAVPRSGELKRLEDLHRKSIATSYPNILSAFLAERGIEAEIHKISGSVEIAPGIGLADAICDLVSSGSTLLSNGLEELVTVLPSEAVLIATESLSPVKQGLLDALRFRINAVNRANNYKYILLNAPLAAVDEICALLPGVKSPTVMPLKTEGWCSLHSVVQENEFWEIIDKLRLAGAEGILVLPIEKMIG